MILRQPFPIDETRYLSVAWEMWHNGDFILPTLNGEPYSHKPPLLFWLMHTGWAVFGVNDYSPRLISLLAALAALPLVSAIARFFWPERPAIRSVAPLVLASFLAWLLYSTTIMFDIVLGFFALAAVVSALKAYPHASLRWFALCGVMLGGGMLTKGPVILLDVLPILVLVPLWRPDSDGFRIGRWYAGILVAVILSALIMLAWVYPAIQRGGPDFENALIWKQTAGRMVESFAHARPWYWYLMLLPILLLPWGIMVWEKAWRGRVWRDAGERFCALWFGVTLLAFSLISGKQIHYLIPVLPAVALWLARRFEERPVRRISLIVLGSLSLLIGIALMLAPEWCQLSGSYPACEDTPRLGGLLPLALGLALLMRSGASEVERLCLIAVFPLALLIGVLVNFIGLSQRQDVRPIAMEIRALQDQGITVVNVDKYHNQYQFAGRLEHPLKVLRGDELRRWAPNHRGAVLIVYQDRNETSLGDVAKAVYPYRGEQALIVSVDDWLRYKRSGAGQ
ncbi:glycosyltransferase [Marinobacter santoriniensis NKSG1]|uniref:Glycosyltransferase n=1 Tax=Marinobacter santoriniensis NKSG1 TaxID=1288826 RepID=M7CQD9_9GAMM|nr:glycosyltransferase [Marinobacter santoriniensis NKSG1]